MAPKEATCGRGARTRDGFVVKNCNFFCTNLAPRTKGVFYSILDKIAYTQILSFSKSFYKYFDMYLQSMRSSWHRVWRNFQLLSHIIHIFCWHLIVKHFGTINTGDFSNKSCWFSDSKFIGNFEVMTNSVAHDLTKKIKYSLKIISEP